MRSHGLLLAAALALSDAISLAHGTPTKKDTGPATDTKASGPKPPAGNTGASDCFTIHLKASGTLDEKQVNLDSGVTLASAHMKPSSYSYPKLTDAGSTADVIFKQSKESLLLVAGTKDPVIGVQVSRTGIRGLVGLYLAPDRDVIDELVVVQANVGKEGGFQADLLANVACKTLDEKWGFGLQNGTTVPKLCIPATVTAIAAACPH